MSDVLDLLENDHRLVEGLLDQLAQSEPGPDRDQLVQQLVASLSVHMQFEESALYPLLQQVDTEAEREAEVEHSLAKDGLAKLQELVQAPGFGAVVDMLKGGIGHHVNDEETEAFPELRSSCDPSTLESLTSDLLSAKRDANVLEAELARSTKEQLVNMAAVAGIEGRSSMTADALRSALARA